MYDDDDELSFDRLKTDLHESIDTVLEDSGRTRVVVHGCHTALLLMMMADSLPEMTLAQRAELYDKASLVLAAAVLGKAEAFQIIGEALSTAQRFNLN